MVWVIHSPDWFHFSDCLVIVTIIDSLDANLVIPIKYNQTELDKTGAISYTNSVCQGLKHIYNIEQKKLSSIIVTIVRSMILQYESIYLVSEVLIEGLLSLVYTYIIIVTAYSDFLVSGPEKSQGFQPTLSKYMTWKPRDKWWESLLYFLLFSNIWDIYNTSHNYNNLSTSLTVGTSSDFIAPFSVWFACNVAAPKLQ